MAAKFGNIAPDTEEWPTAKRGATPKVVPEGVLSALEKAIGNQMNVLWPDKAKANSFVNDCKRGAKQLNLSFRFRIVDEEDGTVKVRFYTVEKAAVEVSTDA